MNQLLVRNAVKHFMDGGSGYEVVVVPRAELGFDAPEHEQRMQALAKLSPHELDLLGIDYTDEEAEWANTLNYETKDHYEELFLHVVDVAMNHIEPATFVEGYDPKKIAALIDGTFTY